MNRGGIVNRRRLQERNLDGNVHQGKPGRFAIFPYPSGVAAGPLNSYVIHLTHAFLKVYRKFT
jgi:hypothetical protein